MRVEVEVKCPYCKEEKERTVKAFGENTFVYICDKCKQKYRVDYERIPTACYKWE